MTVATIVVMNPTSRLTRSAAINSASRNASAYQCQVKPRQIVLNRESLNERATRTTIGAYRNAYTTLVTRLRVEGNRRWILADTRMNMFEGTVRVKRMTHHANGALYRENYAISRRANPSRSADGDSHQLRGGKSNRIPSVPITTLPLNTSLTPRRKACSSCGLLGGGTM